MNEDGLLISANREDFTLELVTIMTIGKFSGKGKAWFNNSYVIEFSRKLIALTDNMEGTAELLGTQGCLDSSDYLETMSLRFYVLSNSKLNGVLGVHCTLSNHPYTGCRKNEIMKVSAELQVRNGVVNNFARNLEQLTNGNIKKINLINNLNIV